MNSNNVLLRNPGTWSTIYRSSNSHLPRWPEYQVPVAKSPVDLPGGPGPDPEEPGAHTWFSKFKIRKITLIACYFWSLTICSVIH